MLDYGILVQKLGLDRAIDHHLHLLKIHLPHQESNHVLNIAYLCRCTGTVCGDARPVGTRRIGIAVPRAGIYEGVAGSMTPDIARPSIPAGVARVRPRLPTKVWLVSSILAFCGHLRTLQMRQLSPLFAVVARRIVFCGQISLAFAAGFMAERKVAAAAMGTAAAECLRWAGSPCPPRLAQVPLPRSPNMSHSSTSTRNGESLSPHRAGNNGQRRDTPVAKSGTVAYVGAGQNDAGPLLPRRHTPRTLAPNRQELHGRHSDTEADVGDLAVSARRAGMDDDELDGDAVEAGTAVTGDQAGDVDESFLLGVDQSNYDASQADGDMEDNSHAARGDAHWYSSDAFQLISCAGSETRPGNRHVSVPRWVLHYFGNAEKAIVFAQILYWFGRSRQGKRRARRKDRCGRTVVDKTFRQLADELGLPNERRIGNCLRAFKTAGLLDYRTIGMGGGRTTRIRLIPAGVLEAYHMGSQRAGESES
jgi:hypothetical protein